MGTMLNTHVHFHVCVVDGVFEQVPGDVDANADADVQASPVGVVFHPATSIDADAVAQVQATLRKLLRSIPELVWATLLLIAAGLGPFAGTLSLGSHTAGVLGRLYAESIENAPSGPAFALRMRGVREGRIFWYATLPQIVPQLLSYTLYRGENTIRAAAVLGVVGGGGLRQMLAFHMGL